MKILFLLGDESRQSLDFRLAEMTEKLIGKDAEIVWQSLGAPLPPSPDGVWIFTHEEDGGCPEALMAYLEAHFSELEDVCAVATGIGGKEGAMNAVNEIAEAFEEHGGRFYDDSERLCIPMRTARFEPEPEDRMDLFFLVDGFLKYCGMDDSESRKIAFETVVDAYFKILKTLSPDGAKPHTLSLDGSTVATDAGSFDCSALNDAPPEIRDLHFEIDSLRSDYEIEDGEIASALLQKIAEDW